MGGSEREEERQGWVFATALGGDLASLGAFSPSLTGLPAPRSLRIPHSALADPRRQILAVGVRAQTTFFRAAWSTAVAAPVAKVNATAAAATAVAALAAKEGLATGAAGWWEWRVCHVRQNVSVHGACRAGPWAQRGAGPHA